MHAWDVKNHHPMHACMHRPQIHVHVQYAATSISLHSLARCLDLQLLEPHLLVEACDELLRPLIDTLLLLLHLVFSTIELAQVLRGPVAAHRIGNHTCLLHLLLLLLLIKVIVTAVIDVYDRFGRFWWVVEGADGRDDVPEAEAAAPVDRVGGFAVRSASEDEEGRSEEAGRAAATLLGWAGL
ncbi:hypothetical protein QJS04_geneDACA007136 [Acorus gramineus]|uniref:Uncharacterized protein n=1 Tax=Acorus gramineus TaxID=55184 RepID=A0AAV9BP24_ACOGR|nr:hypothetical protein QJS04_geneDACA007136 [Acorus gramineus]